MKKMIKKFDTTDTDIDIQECKSILDALESSKNSSLVFYKSNVRGVFIYTINKYSDDSVLIKSIDEEINDIVRKVRFHMNYGHCTLNIQEAIDYLHRLKRHAENK